MSVENLNEITSYFPTAQPNSVPMTLTSTITAGETTVAVTGMTNYTNGNIVCLVVDPDTPSLQQTFTGTYNSGSATVTNVIWTEVPTGGVNVAHSAGATVIDYVTATDWDMAMTGIGQFANQNGTLSTAAVEAALNISNLAANGWNNLGYTLTYGANNGNKEFTATATGNLTAFLSPGMKMNVTRSTVPSTECMAFATASSQYATNASPTGITFTTAFTCESWVYAIAYGGGVVSRYNGTNGFLLAVDAAGQVQLNAGSATYQISYQSVPLNQWVHIAGTFSAGTMLLYINGTLVPSYLTGSATSITQAGALQVGTYNSGTFFNGYIYQPRIWSVAQTQANIQANMAVALTTATNLVFVTTDGAFTDASGVGNNLTAQGGAIATQAANPYNAIEYGVITSISYSSPTTTMTIFTGKSGAMPNQTLSNPQYSLVKEPYGFPGGKDKWDIVSTYKVATGQTTPSTSTWYNSGTQLSIPTGSWDVEWNAILQTNNSGGVTTQEVYGTLSTANNSESDNNWTAHIQFNGATAAIDIENTVEKHNPMSVASQTVYYLNLESVVATSAINFKGDKAATIIRATCGYI